MLLAKIKPTFVFLFTSIVCSISANPANLCGNKSASELTEITDLNDDCLYTTFNHLDLETLNSLAETNLRFTPVARSVFVKRALEGVDNLKEDALVSYGETILKENVKKYIRQCTPNNQRSNDQMLILLFKLLTIMDRYPYHRPTWFINAMKPYVMDIMESQNQFEDITSTLTAYDHYALLSYFENNPNKVAEIEWLYYAYMMIVEKSGHLKQQFTYEMMNKLNRVRNAANAHYLLVKEANSTSSEIEYIEKFKLDWDLYKGDTPSEDFKEKLHLAFAQYAVQTLDKEYKAGHNSSLVLQHFAQVYCATRSLSGENFAKLVNKSNLNFVVFDFSVDNRIINKLRKSLENECGNTAVLESSLQQQLAKFDEFIGEKGNVSDYKALIGKLPPHSNTYHNKLFEKMENVLALLETATNFQDYIKLLRITLAISRYGSNYRLNGLKHKIFHAFFTFVNRPELFDNMNELEQVDRLFIQLYEHKPGMFPYSTSKTVHNEYKNLLNATLHNFEAILSPKINDTQETRIKQRIILKILVLLINGAHDPSRRTDALVLQRIKIINLFFTLASLDPSVLSQDRSLLQEWQDIFCDDLRPNVKIYYVRDDVEALAFVYQPLNVTKDANADSILYLSHLLIVPHLQNFGMPIPDQMLNNILALEESVGDAGAAETYLRSEVIAQRLQFYLYFAGIVRQNQEKTNLKKFVDSKIDLVLSQKAFNHTPMELSIVKSILVAIENNGESARKKLGNELIERLGHLLNGLEYENGHFDGDLKAHYETCKKILNI